MNELIERINKILNGNKQVSRREIFQTLKDCREKLLKQENEITDLIEENTEQAEELEKLKTKIRE